MKTLFGSIEASQTMARIPSQRLASCKVPHSDFGVLAPFDAFEIKVVPLYAADGEIVFREACRLGCEGIVSKRLGSPYRSGRVAHRVKVKNPKAPAVKREAEEDWGRHKTR
jgi:hypothetical protein